MSEQQKREPNNKKSMKSRAVKHKGLPAKERPISSVYPVIDNDLARDNIENDLSSADLQDL